MNLTDPTAFELDIAEVLQREQIDYALYGGLLLAAYGQARETKDADLAVVGLDAEATSSLLARDLRVHTNVAFDRRVFGGLKISRITMIEGDELNTLDLVEPKNTQFARRALERAPASTLRDRDIRVLAPEDFIIFKVLSGRELDLDDASSVIRALGTQLDMKSIEQEIARLAESEISHPVHERWQRAQSVW